MLGFVLFLMGVFSTKAQDATPSQAGAKSQPAMQSLVIAPNLMTELAKFKPVRMPFDSAHLSARERRWLASSSRLARLWNPFTGGKAIPKV